MKVTTNHHTIQRFPFITYPLNCNSLYQSLTNLRFIVKRSNYKNKYLNPSQILLNPSLIKKHKIILKIIKRPNLSTQITNYQKLLNDSQFYSYFLCFLDIYQQSKVKIYFKRDKTNKQNIILLLTRLVFQFPLRLKILFIFLLLPSTQYSYFQILQHPKGPLLPILLHLNC